MTGAQKIGELAVNLADAALVARSAGDDVKALFFATKAAECLALAKALGYKRIGTYILATESGMTLKAAGWRLIGEVKGRSWSCPSRPRVDKHPTQDKLLFETTA